MIHFLWSFIDIFCVMHFVLVKKDPNNIFIQYLLLYFCECIPILYLLLVEFYMRLYYNIIYLKQSVLQIQRCIYKM